jgi:hypothetical protein
MARQHWTVEDARKLRDVARSLEREGWPAADIECIDDVAALLEGSLSAQECDACTANATCWSDRDGVRWWWCEEHARDWDTPSTRIAFVNGTGAA